MVSLYTILTTKTWIYTVLSSQSFTSVNFFITSLIMYMHTKVDQCLTSVYSGNRPQLKPVLNSAALTVLYSQAFYQANVSINSSRFSRNAGTFANSLLIIHYETKETGITEITNSSFSIGNSMFTGACQETGEVILNFSPIVLHTSTVPLIVKNSSFVSHQSSNINLDPVEKRALYIAVIIKGTSILIAQILALVLCSRMSYFKRLMLELVE